MPASVIVVATDWPDDVERARTRHPGGVPDSDHDRRRRPTGRPRIRNRGSAALADEGARGRPDDASGSGHGAAINAGMRRATGGGGGPARRERGADRRHRRRRWPRRSRPGRRAWPAAWGIVSSDLRTSRTRRPATSTRSRATASAFRRADAVERGPLDERFRFYRNLDIWWSLVLRDEGEGSAAAPRGRASADLPVDRHEHRGWTSLPEAERDRLSKRNFYRIIDRFGVAAGPAHAATAA